jgi:ferrous iron transport protein A
LPEGFLRKKRKSKKVTLDLMPKNVDARVASVDPTVRYGLRLMEMGLVPGATVRVVKAAPLGDPIQICIRDYHLALRRSEARAITVEMNVDE